MSEPCIIYTYTVHRDDPDFDRWEHVDFPDGIPTIQIERIETLPITQDSLLLLLNKGFRPFITDYHILEIIADDFGSMGG
ncbi:hypothetical protein ACQZ5G_11210 [Agrobacterium sp. 22-214-1]